MPFEYQNGPSVFQHIMQNVLALYLWIFTLAYIDDIVIYSRTFEEHLTHLDQVLGDIAKAGLTLSPNKCHLGYQSLLLLGQKVFCLGISTHKEKVDAILALEELRNVKKLQTFLGMMVYFSAYVPFYAWIAAPLFELLKKSATGWNWTEQQQEAFELCKEVLTNAPVRAFAMPDWPYWLYTNACDYGLAAILQQVQLIQVCNPKGTKIYSHLRKAFDKEEPVPLLVTSIPEEVNNVPTPGFWAAEFDDITVYIEWVQWWTKLFQCLEHLNWNNYNTTNTYSSNMIQAPNESLGS